MKKIFIFLFLLFSFSFVSAAPAPSSPVCEIVAEVIDINVWHTASFDSEFCRFNERYEPPSRGWTVIQILEVVDEPKVLGYFREQRCKETYSIGREITLKFNEKYPVGTIISGDISGRGDECFGIRYMENVVVLNEPENNLTQKLFCLDFCWCVFSYYFSYFYYFNEKENRLRS